MRFYNIVLTTPAGTPFLFADQASFPGGICTSFVNGRTIAGALNVELDIPVVVYALPMGAAWLRIWGPSLREIGQAADLNGINIAVYGGMAKGLPLANPAQQGLLVYGTIQQAFGNWIGVNQTLELIIQPPVGSQASPKNIVINWLAGTPLATALKNTLSTAFPGFKQNIAISPNLVLAHDEPGYYEDVYQFAQYVKRISRDIIGGSYPGVDIVLTQTTFNVYDGTTAAAPKAILFQDLIGQPTWIDSPLIQFKCVLRGDLAVGGYVTLPPVRQTTTPQSFSQYRANSVFQGSFQIQRMRHNGNFRQRDGESWITTFDAFPALPVTGAAGGSGNVAVDIGAG